MKTISNRKIHHLNAKGQILGRLAVQIADLLRGKHKTNFMPNLDIGDTVIVANAQTIKITGKKLTDKIYYRHSGYPGGLSAQSLKELFQKNPGLVIRKAVYGMLPKNRLRQLWMKRLKIYPGELEEK